MVATKEQVREQGFNGTTINFPEIDFHKHSRTAIKHPLRAHFLTPQTPFTRRHCTGSRYVTQSLMVLVGGQWVDEQANERRANEQEFLPPPFTVGNQFHRFSWSLRVVGCWSVNLNLFLSLSPFTSVSCPSACPCCCCCCSEWRNSRTKGGSAEANATKEKTMRKGPAEEERIWCRACYHSGLD